MNTNTITNNKKQTRQQLIQQILGEIARPNKPSAIGLKLGFHHYTKEATCQKRITELCRYYEPKSVLRMVNGLGLFWAVLNQKLAQKLYSYAKQLVEGSGYEQAIAKEKQHIDYKELQLAMQENVGGADRYQH